MQVHRKICAPLTNNTDARINETEHLLQFIDNLNANELLNDTILVSFNIVNMFPNIDNIKCIEAVKTALQNRPSQKPSTGCIIEGLGICLYNNNSKLNYLIIYYRQMELQQGRQILAPILILLFTDWIN